MSIEMGESLVFSWLRHVKKCQVVQLNWKISSQWELKNEEKLESLKAIIHNHFYESRNYNIFKNTKLSQFLKQGECDAVGVSIQKDRILYHGVDVAFHEKGLIYNNYKNSKGVIKTEQSTVMTIVKKCIRTALIFIGYFDTEYGEIVFAAPIIRQANVYIIAKECIEELNELLEDNGYHFKFRIIANEDFNNEILKKVKSISGQVSDTSELFLRSYQMIKLFPEETKDIKQSNNK